MWMHFSAIYAHIRYWYSAADCYGHFSYETYLFDSESRRTVFGHISRSTRYYYVDFPKKLHIFDFSWVFVYLFIFILYPPSNKNKLVFFLYFFFFLYNYFVFVCCSMLSVYHLQLSDMHFQDSNKRLLYFINSCSF